MDVYEHRPAEPKTAHRSLASQIHISSIRGQKSVKPPSISQTRTHIDVQYADRASRKALAQRLSELERLTAVVGRLLEKQAEREETERR